MWLYLRKSEAGRSPDECITEGIFVKNQLNRGGTADIAFVPSRYGTGVFLFNCSVQSQLF